MGFFEDEIDRLKEENRNQHEQILALQAQLQNTEEKMHKVTSFLKTFINENNGTTFTQNHLIKIHNFYLNSRFLLAALN